MNRSFSDYNTPQDFIKANLFPKFKLNYISYYKGKMRFSIYVQGNLREGSLTQTTEGS